MVDHVAFVARSMEGCLRPRGLQCGLIFRQHADDGWVGQVQLLVADQEIGVTETGQLQNLASVCDRVCEYVCVCVVCALFIPKRKKGPAGILVISMRVCTA